MIDSFRGKYYFLSNFYLAPVTYNGFTYSNNEAAFQAQKTVDIRERMIFATLDPSAAKRRGRVVDIRPDWDSVKIEIMKDIVRAKFTTNTELGEQLLATGDEVLVEGNTWNDKFWGVCNGHGLNHLGIILMEVRDELKQTENQKEQNMKTNDITMENLCARLRFFRGCKNRPGAPKSIDEKIQETENAIVEMALAAYPEQN